MVPQRASVLADRRRHPRRDVAQEREVPRVEPRVLRLAERIGRRYPRERPRLQLVANADRVDAFLGRTREQRERVVGRGRDASSRTTRASCAGVGARPNAHPPPRVAGSGIGSVNRTGTRASWTAAANASSYSTEAPTMIASARASTASRRSSRTVFDGLPATSVIFSFTRGVPEAC